MAKIYDKTTIKSEHMLAFRSFCKENTLNSTAVSRRIVICNMERIRDNRPAKAREVQRTGGVGMILVDPVATDVAFQFVVPTALIGVPEARVLIAYVNSDP